MGGGLAKLVLEERLAEDLSLAEDVAEVEEVEEELGVVAEELGLVAEGRSVVFSSPCGAAVSNSSSNGST